MGPVGTLGGAYNAGRAYFVALAIRRCLVTAKAIKFIQSLKVPTGDRAGKPFRLAPFQKAFLKGALAKDITIAALSVARGGGKSTLIGGIALGHLLGEIDPQPARECLLVGRTREQGRIVFDYVAGLARSLPDDIQKRLTFRKAPRLEIEFDAPDGPHVLRVLPADGRTSLGTSPTLCISDERAHHHLEKGNDLEHALLSGIGKRHGRYVMISTSAPNDAHPFSKWLDEPPPGCYVQEHKADNGCPPDDIEQIKKANPGAEYGIGASVAWLKTQADRAIARGGSALSTYRLYNLNQRVSDESRSVLLTTDQWLACETDDLPLRDGPLVVGLDMGGSSSMSAWANFWPTTGRLECYGAFPNSPDLISRGQNDGVSDRYVQMRDRGELSTFGANVVPVDLFMNAMLTKLEGYPIAAICCDRFRQAEFQEAVAKTSIRATPIFRGAGWRDAGEDTERFRQFVMDHKVKALPSLLLRSAFADAVVLIDPTGAAKPAKGRSLGRIDAAVASLIAIAQGARMIAKPVRQARAPIWA